MKLAMRRQGASVVLSSCRALQLGAAHRHASTQPCGVESEVVPEWDCVKFEHCVRAMHRIRSGVMRTECRRSHWLSSATGCEIWLKSEHQQFTGSFKERGARNSLLSLSADERLHGVVAASAGNHALALAWHGADLGIPVTVVMPTIAPMAKVDRCRVFGANVVLVGQHIGEAREYAMTHFSHQRYVNGYDDPEIIAGTGTLGMEMLEQLPECDVAVVPVGGCGLIAGVALAMKTLNPSVRVIGVEPLRCASYTAALDAGRPVQARVQPTLADGLAVPKVGAHAFAVARHWVDEVVQVDEGDVALAVLRLVENEKMVVEGGGATGLAALLPGGPLDRPDLKGKHVLVPLCGGNMDVTTLGRVIDRGLAADGRLIRLSVPVSDRPGGIADVTRVIAGVGASVKDIFHERTRTRARIASGRAARSNRPRQPYRTPKQPAAPAATAAVRASAAPTGGACVVGPRAPRPGAWLQNSVDQVVIKAVLETRGPEHNTELLEVLQRSYPDARMTGGD